MVGETLEKHCRVLYDTTLRPLMPTATFGKDNDASDGAKGDFIFRDYDNGLEYISIMFEMKNEMDETGAKTKNERLCSVIVNLIHWQWYSYGSISGIRPILRRPKKT